MKKCLILIVCMLLCNVAYISADELNLSQLRLRGDIKNFLQQEGYLPEIDSDGDIKFKKEGDSYYVIINPGDTSPMYVMLSRVLANPEGYTPEAIKLASAELNLYKGVKMLCFEKSISIRTEMYLTSADAFKNVFNKLLQNIQYAENDLMDALNKAAGAAGSSSGSASSFVPFMATKMEIANVDYDGKFLTNYGETIYSYNTRYLKPKITVTPMKGDGTYTVYVKLFQDGVLKTGSSSPSGYSYSTEVTISGSSQHTFQLSGWGSNTAGHWTAGKYRFEVWYGDYCIGSKDFRVY